MTDQNFIKRIFIGDNAAFRQFYIECRTLFMAYFTKHYPNTKISLTDLYQDSIMETWCQIVDGKMTEGHLRCSLTTYVISIGLNKMREGYRGLKKQDKLYDVLKKHPDAYSVVGESKIPVLVTEDEHNDEYVLEKMNFLKAKYKKLGYPCSLLLRYTWYNNMTDNEILEAFGGYFANTNSLKTKRYKCRQTLNNMYNAWKISR